MIKSSNQLIYTPTFINFLFFNHSSQSFGHKFTSGESSAKPNPCLPLSKICKAYGISYLPNERANIKLFSTETVSSSAVCHKKVGGVFLVTCLSVDIFCTKDKLGCSPNK